MAKLTIVGEYQRDTGRLLPPIEGMEFIYFVEAISTDRIKIGQTVNPYKRLSLILTDCPYPIRVQLVLPLPMVFEDVLHKKFAEFRLNGGWFEYTPQIQGFIDRCLDKSDQDVFEEFIDAEKEIISETCPNFWVKMPDNLKKYLTK